MENKPRKTVFLSIQKILFFVLIIYEGWFLECYEAIPFFLQVITVLIVLLSILL